MQLHTAWYAFSWGLQPPVKPVDVSTTVSMLASVLGKSVPQIWSLLPRGSVRVCCILLCSTMKPQLGTLHFTMKQMGKGFLQQLLDRYSKNSVLTYEWHWNSNSLPASGPWKQLYLGVDFWLHDIFPGVFFCILIPTVSYLYLLAVSCSSVRRILANPCLVPRVVMTLSLQIFQRVANWLLWLLVGRAPGRTQRLCKSHDDLSLTTISVMFVNIVSWCSLNMLLTPWLEYSCKCLLSGDTGQCSKLLQLLRHATIWRHSISGCRPCCFISFICSVSCFCFCSMSVSSGHHVCQAERVSGRRAASPR